MLWMVTTKSNRRARRLGSTDTFLMNLVIARFQPVSPSQNSLSQPARRTSDSQHENLQLHHRNLAVVKFANRVVTERHANELPTTCSHNLFTRSCSSYHASSVRASSGQQNLLVSVETNNHDHRRRQTKGGTGLVQSFKRRAKDSLLQGPVLVLAGRRSPSPPSSVTWRLPGDEVRQTENSRAFTREHVAFGR